MHLLAFFVDRHEEQVAELERRWLEQIERLKKGQGALEIERCGVDGHINFFFTRTRFA